MADYGQEVSLKAGGGLRRSVSGKGQRAAQTFRCESSGQFTVQCGTLEGEHRELLHATAPVAELSPRVLSKSPPNVLPYSPYSEI